MNLPPPIAWFLRAFNAKDTDAFLASFAPDALVTDEEHEYRGRTAMKGWFATANREPLRGKDELKLLSIK